MRAWDDVLSGGTGPLSGRFEGSRQMNTFSDVFVLVAVGAVVLVLALGLVNMMRGGSASRSQNLMRARVLLQALALVVIMGVVWYRAL